jgi:hypothetical protein
LGLGSKLYGGDIENAIEGISNKIDEVDEVDIIRNGYFG